jgi:hypothetical protein
MHLIVEIVMVGDVAPRAAGPSELVIQDGVEPDDSSVEFRRDTDLREKTPFELPWGQPRIGRHCRDAMNAVVRKQVVGRDGDRVQCTVASKHRNEALFDEPDSLGKAGSVANSRSSFGIVYPMTPYASYAASVSSVMEMPNNRLKPDGRK